MHTARECQNPPRCPLCADLDRPHNHILGGRQCAPQRRDTRSTRGMAPTQEESSKRTALSGSRNLEQNMQDTALMPCPQRKPRPRTTGLNPDQMEIEELVELPSDIEVIAQEEGIQNTQK